MATMLFTAAFLLLAGACAALDNGLALTPPMGFNNWERFRCNIDCKKDPENCISEHLYTSIADALVAGGYRAAGYEYVNIDDCWLSRKRDAHGRLQPDPERFPHGIKWLADYIHSRGLKFGIYQDVGTLTCAGYPGIQGHERIDAQTFADWGVDYVKLDGCYRNVSDYAMAYPLFGAYMNATGRPMVYSCSWPAYETFENMEPPYAQIRRTCNLWRNYADIQDSFDSLNEIANWFGDQTQLRAFAGPGGWNDPDMLIIGDYGLSRVQAEAQMAIWSILAAPLLISADIRPGHHGVGPEFARILLNGDAIAINQDALGLMGERLHVSNRNNSRPRVEVWRRAIEPTLHDDTSYAFAVWNKHDDGMPRLYNHTLEYLGLNAHGGYYLRDVFSARELGLFHVNQWLALRVDPSGGVRFIRATLAGAMSPRERARVQLAVNDGDL